MNKTGIIAALIFGLIIGSIGTFAFQSDKESLMQKEMEGMMAGLAGKTGDEFDKAFLSEMIVHHEGAVGMAEMALQSAGHQEIKTMADAIISAQTSEITQMKNWLKEWYRIEIATSTVNHNSH